MKTENLSSNNDYMSNEAATAISQIKEYIKNLSNKNRPLVVIKCITYNHEKFIRDALEGFVMQQTNFPFVVVIHDDASTDGTAAIILEYAEKYPDIIFPIIERENQYFKPGGPLTKVMYDACEAMRAKYVALCEGDDYWTDPLKLQKQVDFLESHPDYVMCTHNYREYFQNEGKFGPAFNLPSQEYTLQSYINNSKDWIYLTLTTVYRAESLKLEEFLKYPDRRDTVQIYYLLKQGKGWFMEDDMGVYRKHGGGVWTKILKEKNPIEEAFQIGYKVRQGIHQVENSEESSLYILNHITNCKTGRLFSLKHPKILMQAIRRYASFVGYSKAIGHYIDFMTMRDSKS